MSRTDIKKGRKPPNYARKYKLDSNPIQTPGSKIYIRFNQMHI